MEENTSIVKVALPLNINSLFSYAVPDGQTLESVIGRRALVNFNNRKLRGYVVEPGEYSDKYQIKPILKVIDKRPVFTTEAYNLARWIADYYFAGVGEVLSMMIPKGSRAKKNEATKSLPVAAPVLLTPSQQNVYDSIKIDIQNDKKKFYLYGVTGSGKTMIYIKLIEDVLNSGKNAIFLVPEIALSYQTLQRLQEKFGSLCALLHSGL
ncbi:MAG TPA: DEAD/DEAH box helicase family protein, partial [Spirochaetota bacterium]|nr:DEAD/DEAH box helicase family protein [Spirochaetota bacterium]